MGRRSAIPPSRGAVLGLCSLELASDRYTWRAITFLASRAGRLRDTPHGRGPPAMGRPVLMPGSTNAKSGSRAARHVGSTRPALSRVATGTTRGAITFYRRSGLSIAGHAPWPGPAGHGPPCAGAPGARTRRTAVEQHVTSAVFFLGLGNRYAWRAITFLAAWAGRLRDTPHGRDPPAIGCPVLMPGSTNAKSGSRAARLVGNTRSLYLLSSDRYTWRAITFSPLGPVD